MDSTLNFRNSRRTEGRVTENREMRPLIVLEFYIIYGHNQKRRDNAESRRRKLRGSQCRTLTFRNRVSLRLLVSCPEPLQFQSKWQCFSESSNVSTTKNWIYKSSNILVKKKKKSARGPQVGLWPTPLGTILFFQMPGIQPVASLLSVTTYSISQGSSNPSWLWSRTAAPPVHAVPASKQTGPSNSSIFLRVTKEYGDKTKKIAAIQRQKLGLL